MHTNQNGEGSAMLIESIDKQPHDCALQRELP